MKTVWIVSSLLLAMVSCSTYQPLEDRCLYDGRPLHATPGKGVTVTYFGNTTILVSDGTTHLLVDGFFSRPGPVRSLLWTISPDQCEVRKQLAAANIKRLDAVLVGHSHHDHALDSAFVAKETGAVVMGSGAYQFIHRGMGKLADQEKLIVVTGDERAEKFGDFTVTFRRSEHVRPHTKIHELVMGDIHDAVATHSHFTKYQCGEVYAIHIAHRDGTIAITTTAGARKDQFKGLRADVVMLGVGLLGKEPKNRQMDYWRETVGVLGPHTVIPVHWDAFTKKLRGNLAAPGLKRIDDVRAGMQVVKNHRTRDHALWVMDFRDSIRLRKGVMQAPVPKTDDCR